MVKFLGPCLVLATWLSAAPSAQACASCESGDRTLTTLGMGQPFSGRFRIGSEILQRIDRVGSGDAAIELEEYRWNLATIYTPTWWFALGLHVPLTYRVLTEANLASHTLIGPGDAGIDTRFTVFRDRVFAPRHLLSLRAGLRFPTGSIEQLDAGMPREVQAGAGALSPSVGLGYTVFSDPFSLFSSSSVVLPLDDGDGNRAPSSLFTTVRLQWQPLSALAVHATASHRWDSKGREGGRPEPDTGGTLLYLAPGLSVLLEEDLVVTLAVALPAYQDLSGNHRESAVTTLSMVYDL
ncbi:MAG: hypothetical protein KC416_08330 [Myxococcales bacterium]|nr:hypothetical protein [Myxococcales bacterium]